MPPYFAVYGVVPAWFPIQGKKHSADALAAPALCFWKQGQKTDWPCLIVLVPIDKCWNRLAVDILGQLVRAFCIQVADKNAHVL